METNLTSIELIKEIAEQYNYNITDKQADRIAWNYTGFPVFFDGDPKEEMRDQVGSFFECLHLHHLHPDNAFQMACDMRSQIKELHEIISTQSKYVEELERGHNLTCISSDYNSSDIAKKIKKLKSSDEYLEQKTQEDSDNNITHKKNPFSRNFNGT